MVLLDNISNIVLILPLRLMEKREDGLKERILGEDGHQVREKREG